MLARNFMTAADLALSEAEVGALISVLHMLERGELVDTQFGKSTVPNGFCMSSVRTSSDCGTAACIMGWAQTFPGAHFNVSWSTYPRAMYDLFMYGDARRHKVTSEQAARALSNYLTGGDAQWDEILG